MSSNVPANTELVILDPGLHEIGGHHPAFILSLLRHSMFKDESASLTVYSNSGFQNCTALSLAKINPFFKTDFYRYFYSNPSYLELADFVRSLSSEYYRAIKQLTYANKGLHQGGTKSQIFLFPTLGAEHAIALADALILLKKNLGITINVVVMTMFSPYRSCNNVGYDRKTYLRYRLGFKSLASNHGVSFFACDFETSKAYEYILGRKIKICPLPFIRHNNYSRDQAQQSRQIILYLGDTKATKGFLALPTMVRQILKADSTYDCHYIIQYTLTNKSSEFVEVDKQLKKFAKRHKKINIHDEFWSEEELHQTLSNSSTIIFNYDTQVYKFQSSGILWLAAHYHLRMIFLSENWLTREAERLNCDYSLCTMEDIHLFDRNFNKRHISKDKSHVKISRKNFEEYAEILFGDFNSWLRVNLADY